MIIAGISDVPGFVFPVLRKVFFLFPECGNSVMGQVLQVPLHPRQGAGFRKYRMVSIAFFTMK